MSDMEDDFMCDDEEDYDLVSTAIIQLLPGFCLTSLVWQATQSEVQR